MKLEYVLVRAFNQDKWWNLYTKANATKIRLIKNGIHFGLCGWWRKMEDI